MFAFIHTIQPAVLLLVVGQIYRSQLQRLTSSNHFAGLGPHVYSRLTTPAQLQSPVHSSALGHSSTNAKALRDDELSDLSSLPPSPDPSRAPSLVTTPRHNLNSPQTASSPNLTPRELVSKTRIERPTGASRTRFSELVSWDDRLIKSIKVRQKLTAFDYASF